MTPTEQDKELREQVESIIYTHSWEGFQPEGIDELIQLITADRERVELDKEEMTLRYAIQILQDTNKEFALENLQRQLDKNLAQQEEV